MALGDELAFEGKHHLVKISFGGKVEAYLDAQVAGARPFRQPAQAYFFSPSPSSFGLACPDGGHFVPGDFCTRGLAEKLWYTLRLVHVVGGSFEV